MAENPHVPVVPPQLLEQRRRHAAFAEAHRRFYHERQGTLEILDATADALPRADGAAPNILVVSGERGCGKSSLIAYWLDQWQRAHPGMFVVPHFIGASSSETDHEEVIREIIEEIRARLSLDESAPRTGEALVDSFARWLNRVRTEPLLIIIDALDRIAGEGGTLEWLPTFLQPNQRLIVTAADGPVLDRLLERGWARLRIMPLSRQDRIDIVRHHLLAYRPDVNLTIASRLAASSHAANALFLRTNLAEMQAVRHPADFGKRIDYYLSANSIGQLFQRVLERYELTHGSDIVREVLSLILISRRGLSEAEISGASSTGGAAVPELLCDFGVHLRCTDDLFMFSHDFLRDTVRERYFSGDGAEVGERRMRRRLIRYFGTCGDADRSADELRWQLYKIGDARGLFRVLQRMDILALLSRYERQHELQRFWHFVRSRIDDAPQQLIGTLRQFVHDSPGSDTLRLLDVLGGFIGRSADMKSSQAIFEMGTETAIRCHKPLAAATTLLHTADVHRLCGRFVEARETLAAACDLMRQNSAPVFDVLSAEVQRIKLDSVAGDVNEARKACDRVISEIRCEPGCRRLLPGALIQACSIYGTLGIGSEAVAFGTEALTASERMFGNEHPSTIHCLYVLAGALVAHRSFAEAEATYERAFRLTEELYGPNHPDIGYGLVLYGGLLRQVGKLEQALAVHQRAYALLAKAQPPEHPNRLLAQSSLARSLQLNEMYPEARAYMTEALGLREKHFGPGHAETIRARLDLARLLAEVGEHGASLDLYRKTIPAIEPRHLITSDETAIHIEYCRQVLDALHRTEADEPDLYRSMADHTEVSTPGF